MTRPMADIPGFKWTEKLDPRFSEKTPQDVLRGINLRASTMFDKRSRSLRRLAANEGPAVEKINSTIRAIATDVRTHVQIGAHDGSFDDPFAAFIREFDWRAVLVEPQKDVYERLSSRYADSQRVRTVRSAVSDQAGELILYKAMLDVSERQEFGTAIAATNPDQVRSEVKRCLGSRGLKSMTIVPEVVPSVTPAQLLDDLGVAPTDVTIFATDTEGHDARIVRAMLSETDLVPQIIQYEHLHTQPAEAYEVDRNLGQLGYELTKTHKDTFASLV